VSHADPSDGPREPGRERPSRRRFLQGFGATAAAGAVGVLGWREVTRSGGEGPAAPGGASTASSSTPAPQGPSSPNGADPNPVPTSTADVRALGAVGDGRTDDTAAFEAALSQSVDVRVPPGSYVISRPLDVPPRARILGSGKYNTQLLHAHDGDFAVLRSRASLADLFIDGQGGDFGGRGLVLAEGEGQQSLQNVAVIGFDGYCIDFETTDAGSQFRATQLDVARVDAGSGSERYAVHIAAGRQLASVPRSFTQVETQGQCAFDFGGCNDLYVVASTLGDLKFSAESRGVNISASRLLNQESLTIDGHGVTIVGCDIAAQITLAPGADHLVVAPNAFNRLPVVDRSGNQRHQLPPDYTR
jgi:hypothetical protein